MNILISYFAILSFLIIIGPQYSESYRILAIFPFQGRSHFMMYEALMKGLARKGHQVDVISPFPLKKSYPNYTDIVHFDFQMEQFVNNMSYELSNFISSDVVHFVAVPIGNKLCESLDEPNILKIIRNPPKNPPYDLVITEVFGAHCYMAFGHHFKVPTIGVSSSALYPWQNGMIRNPANLAFVPNNLVNMLAPMTFLERLYNAVHAIYSDLRFQYYTTPQTKMIKKVFGPNAPDVRESERNLALVLVNSHPALNGPRPIAANLIEVGGLHVQDDGVELPLDLKKWMDDSKDGFIYFTFGSMVTIESFPEHVIRIFYKSLKKIAPVRILMKIPDPKKLPPRLPENIRTFVWASQCKVLQHKNIKAFITHGGLMGGQEAIHYAVPMIGIPLFADQYINVDLYAAKKIAVKLNVQDLTEEKLDNALNEILYNPIYRNSVAELSKRFLDRPMSSLETAIYWVEYIIRHGKDVLRSPAMDLSWWQIELLDVYGALLLIAAIAIFLAIKLIKLIANTLCLNEQSISESKKSN